MESRIFAIKHLIMIDKDGYRPNVGIILANAKGQVLWAKRNGSKGWQFPQGGIDTNETPEQALFRELKEEIGLTAQHVQVLACTKGWISYRLPNHMVRKPVANNPVCIGQKQKWFLLQMLAEDSCVNTMEHDQPEFEDWRWVSYWYPVNQIVSFKREVYRRAMKELCYPHSRLVFKHTIT